MRVALLLSIAFAVGAHPGAAAGTDAAAARQSPPQAAAPGLASAPRWRDVEGGDTAAVRVRDRRLTAEFRGASWSAVLEELRRATGIAVRVHPRPAGTVTVAFTDLPLEQAIPRLFGPAANFVVFYATPGGLPVEIWIFGADGLPAAPVPRTEMPAGDRQRTPDPRPMPPAGGGPRPALTPARVEALAADGSDDALDALETLVTSEADGDLRAMAAGALVKLGTPRAVAALSQMVYDHEVASRLSGVEMERLRELLGKEHEPVGRMAIPGDPAPGSRQSGEVEQDGNNEDQ